MGKKKFITSGVLVGTSVRVWTEDLHVGIGTFLFGDLINCGRSVLRTKCFRNFIIDRHQQISINRILTKIRNRIKTKRELKKILFV